jgi:glycosyltransferase involved in cell wall biosynthesis
MSHKLCIIVPAHWEAIMGGSQYQAKVLTEHLLAHYDVQVVYLTTRSNPSFTPDGYRVVQFSDRSGIRKYGSFFDALRLYRTLREIAPDTILQAVGSAHTGIAAFYARRHGCRMLWRITHDRTVAPEPIVWWHVHKRIERWFLEYGIRTAHLILAQSRYQRDQLARNYGRHDAIVLANFHPAAPDLERSRRDYLQVIWIGNLKPFKNPGAFVRLARGFANRSDVRFVMIGAAMDDGEWTRTQLGDIARTPNIEYLGKRSQDDVNDALCRSDLLVCTSDHEGFSNTFIQAWMRRVPVASLRVDPDGLLSRGRLGSVAQTEQRLFVDVANWLGSPAERLAVGQRCRDYSLAHHSEANIAELARLLDMRARTDAAPAAAVATQPA